MPPAWRKNNGRAALLMPNLDPANYPSSFFFFVNQASPVTQNNFNRVGQFCSAGITSAGTGIEAAERYLAGTLDFLPFAPKVNFTGLNFEGQVLL